MAFDEALGTRIRDLLDADEFAQREIEERRMFGGLAFLDHGRMFIGVVGDDLMARVGPQRHEQALESAHVRPMDFTGKPMLGYVYVARPGFASKPALLEWLTWTLEHVDTLPAKRAKPTKPAKVSGSKKRARRGRSATQE